MPQRTFAKPVEVQITGSILTYDINDPLGGKGEPVKALAAQFPDLRRFIREGYVRYAFTRFGVPYVVSIQCLDSVASRAAAGLPRGLSRRRAFPQGAAHRRRPTLAAANGYPVRRSPNGRPNGRPISPIARPATSSRNSGYRKQGGRADLTAYSQIRFPLEKAPAFAHSQSLRAASRATSRDRAGRRIYRLSLAG